MLKTVKGIYTEGNIILLEKPEDISYSKALITFIDDSLILILMMQ